MEQQVSYTSFNDNEDHIVVCHNQFSEKEQNSATFNEEKLENIRKRVISDKNKIEKTCAKYLGIVDPWLPVRPQENVQNYYVDNDKKRGWCVNAKVRII